MSGGDISVQFAPGFDWAPPAIRTDSRVAEVPNDPRSPNDPRGLRAATSVYRASRHPAVIGVDSTVAFGGAIAASHSLRASLLCAGFFVIAGLLLGLWQLRSPPEAQGIGWYFRPLVGVAVVSGTTVAATSVGAAQAATAAAGAAVTLLALRTLLWLVISSARRRGAGLQPTLLVGPPDSVTAVQHRLRTFPEAGLRFEGAYSPRANDFVSAESRQALVDRLATNHKVKHVLCLVQDVDEPVFKDLVRFADGDVEVSVVLPLARLIAPHTRSHIGDLGLLPIHIGASWGSSVAKRVLDLVGAGLLCIALSPLLILTAIAIRLGDPGPAIFRQRRVGRDGRIFTIYKFRSMVKDAESHQEAYRSRNVTTGILFKLDNDPRVTPVGAVIRRFSIDELPQLLNVLKGDMSLVGPRPLAAKPDDFEASAQIRHRVLPGITGLWQVKGANALSYSDMVDLDLTYVATHSLGVDLIILLRTIPAVLIRRDPY